ncbi:HIRA-interacting protein 3-like [Hydractinia symbiolongicarpus]|uniref:HIRA-interacting protein 3-like n=1 Tax=Hydractinia symbiolongicarpus TaxID=13093 RepID=UPI00254A7642|nr:HIRA-interacting protein 3-like [Hydractinia symbiolongicarpus]
MRKTENKKINPLNDTVSSVSSSEDSSSDDEPLTKRTKENDCIDDKNDLKKVSDSDKQPLLKKLEIEDTTVLCKPEDEESKVGRSDKSTSNDTDAAIKTKPTTEQSNKKKRKRSGCSSEENVNKKAKLSTKVSTKLSNLMRYVRACGVHVGNYAKIFEGCNSMKSKEEKLTNMLKDLGIKGRPSLSQCKKIRLRREEEREVAELDVGNIMSGNRRSQSKSAISSAQKENEPPTSRKYVFGSLSDLDSERSEDEGIKCVSLGTNKVKKKRIMSDSEDEVDE